MGGGDVDVFRQVAISGDRDNGGSAQHGRGPISPWRGLR